ncbi:MAG TPA: hypothetical protein VF990_15730 [Candidatus Dormibacteraeota bacterium]
MNRPDDECPYPRPFAVDFDSCPAYQARQFIPLDTMYQPLDPVLTCRHLETRALTERHRWYAACALGDADARRRWVREVGAARLERLRAVQRALAAAIAPYTTRLWELKGQQLRALRAGKDPELATGELRRLGGQMTDEISSFVKGHAQELAAIEMPPDATMQLVRAAVARFVDTHFATEVTLEVPEELLKRFPEPVQSFFRPPVPKPPAAKS